jgi:hypothetical protein
VIAIGLAVLVAAHAADYVTFLAMVLTRGLDAELNPIVAAIAERQGLVLLTTAKAAAVLVVASSVVILARNHPRMMSVVMVAGILAGSVGAVSNLATI